MTDALIQPAPCLPTTPRDGRLSLVSVVAMLLLLGTSYLFNGMDRQMFPALLGPISHEYRLTLSEGGFLGTIFAVNIALFGAIAGWLMKRYSRRAVLVVGLLSYSAFTILTPFATSFTTLAIYRALTGAGEALHICAIFSILGAYFGPRRGAAMGVNNSFFGVGAFLGPVLGTELFGRTGSWEVPFYAFGIAGAVVALLVLAVVPKRFSEAEDKEGVADQNSTAVMGPSSVVNRNLVISCFAFGLLGVTFFAYAALYATFLRSQLGYTTIAAGTAFGMYGIGSLGGCFGGWLSEKLRKPGMIGALGLLALISHQLFHGSASFAAQCSLSLTFGFLVSGYLFPRFFAVLQRNAPAHQMGFATSIGMPCFYLPGLLAGYLFGHLVEAYGWSIAANSLLVIPAFMAMILMVFYCTRQSRGA